LFTGVKENSRWAGEAARVRLIVVAAAFDPKLSAWRGKQLF
jgi:hypothetical protein